MLIKLKSNRSKKQPKQFQNKKQQQQQQKPVSKEEPKQSWLSRVLEVKESQWHDEEYDAGKDW